MALFHSFVRYFQSFVLILTLSQSSFAQVTAYGQIPWGQTGTNSAGQPIQTATLAAYDETVWIPPTPPNPPPALTYQLDVLRDAAAVTRLSIPHEGGSFFGFSIEMSVISQVVGKNSSLIHPIFLNFLANLVERSGSIDIRWGGNTQEYAVLVPDLPNGRTLAKQASGSKQTTETPAVLYTLDMFYMMTNISNFVNVRWYLGIPFNQTDPWRLDIAEHAEAILGDRLLGFQAGNEPDLYELHQKRPTGYSPQDYFNEVGDLIKTLEANQNIPIKNNLITPSVSSSFWTPELVWNTGFIDAYKDHMFAFAVERYPNNNCFAQYGIGNPVDFQQTFPAYLTHQAGVRIASDYVFTSGLAVAAQKPLIMFETNTASCGGFPGISNNYGAALWGIDYGLQLAYTNFTQALLHFGGQSVYYNPFTAPPTNQSTYNQWTVGAVYYSALVLAEVFGKTNTSRIVDLQANGGNEFTPAYAIYENNVLTKVALINYMDAGNNTAGQPVDLKVHINIPNAGVPGTVRVKYLASTTVTSKNITWAGQSFGAKLDVDGRLQGSLDVPTITCTTVCEIPVPAPGFALVFMDSSAEDISIGQSPQTFATTRYTKLHGTATVDKSVLETSNGHSGGIRAFMGSTSPGGSNVVSGSPGSYPSFGLLFLVLALGWLMA